MTLIANISSSSNNHLLRAEVNCFNSTRCVVFTKTSISCRKLGDQDIHEIATHEGVISDIYDRKWYLKKLSLQVSTSFPCVCLGYFLDLYKGKAYFQFVPQLDLIFFINHHRHHHHHHHHHHRRRHPSIVIEG